MKYSLLLLFYLSFLSASAQEEKVFAFSLQDAIDYAFNHHSSVLNAYADEERAEAQRKEVRGIGLPQLNASFDVANYVKLPTSLIPAKFFDPNAADGEFTAVQFGTKYNATAAIQASQLLFSGDYIVALQSSGTFIDLTKKGTTKTKTDLALEISKAYYGILINQEQIKLLFSNVDRLEKLKGETEGLFRAGFAEKTDVDRLTVSLNNLKVQQSNLQKMLALGYASLKFQMGMDIGAQLTLTDELDKALLAQVSLADEEFNYEDRIEYQLLETQQKFTGQALKLNKYAYLPNLVLYGNLSSQAQGNELFGGGSKWYPISIVGLTLNVPVFDGLQKNFKIQQSKIDVLKLENEMKNLKRGIDFQLESSLVMLENSLASMEGQQENIDLAKSVFDTMTKKYSLGVGTSIEVIEAEAALKEAQTNYYNALYEAIVAKLQYESAKGTLLK